MLKKKWAREKFVICANLMCDQFFLIILFIFFTNRINLQMMFYIYSDVL